MSEIFFDGLNVTYISLLTMLMTTVQLPGSEAYKQQIEMHS